ncbi:MAG: hypothetical protein ACFFB3_03505 [Candidatus Hodarchaeota archaeon]
MSDSGLVFLGIGLALAASALQNFGMGFQKVGMENIKLISSRETFMEKLSHARVWLLGTAMTFISWAFFLAALTYVGISIVQPILIGGIVFVVFFAIFFLNERTLPHESIGIASCILGACLVALEAEKVNREKIQWEITLLFAFVCLMLVLSAASMLHSYLVLKKSPLSAGGAVSGILTGLGAVFARSLTLEETNPLFFLISIHFWLLVGFQAASFIMLQAAFHRERAITVIPLYGGFAVLIPVVAGILVFSEKMGFFLSAGVILILVGIILLSRIGAEILAPDDLRNNSVV